MNKEKGEMIVREFKVGDRVRVRSWESMSDEYGVLVDGDRRYIPIKEISFWEDMIKFCGKEATIESVSHTGLLVRLKDCESPRLGWKTKYWAPEMFEYASEDYIAEAAGEEVAAVEDNNDGLTLYTYEATLETKMIIRIRADYEPTREEVKKEYREGNFELSRKRFKSIKKIK